MPSPNRNFILGYGERLVNPIAAPPSKQNKKGSTDRSVGDVRAV